VSASRCQAPPLAATPSGSTVRVVTAPERPAYRDRTCTRSMMERWSAARWGDAGGEAAPQPPASGTTASAAAEAGSRNGSGNARTSLRSADLASGASLVCGPARRNSARVSAAFRPLRSPGDRTAGGANAGPRWAPPARGAGGRERHDHVRRAQAGLALHPQPAPGVRRRCRDHAQRRPAARRDGGHRANRLLRGHFSRFRDPWGNLWWVYRHGGQTPGGDEASADWTGDAAATGAEEWAQTSPELTYIHDTLMTAMPQLRDQAPPGSARVRTPGGGGPW
jgi:hypothetical protein